jgi:hypothetical protein
VDDSGRLRISPDARLEWTGLDGSVLSSVDMLDVRHVVTRQAAISLSPRGDKFLRAELPKLSFLAESPQAATRYAKQLSVVFRQLYADLL